MVTEQTRNYLIIGSIIAIAFMFMQGTTTQAAGDTSGWEDLGQNFLQTLLDMFQAIADNKILLGLLVAIVVGIIIFRK